ncbi:MAG: HAD-IB family hydrolase [Acidimicrobiia bacterium]|nr:HAD-IB family hydrolase [Acidimicrobiia bacterium]
MADAAAVFDLDRTLLLGSSGPVISAALRERGVLRRGQTGVERFVFGLFDTVGETLPSMLIGRQGARAARGWCQEQVREVGRAVAPELAERIEPYARQAIERHQSAGLKVVLATTTPYDLIEPLATLLDLDDVLATRYRVDDTGRYDGTIDGEYVWSRGKARSVVHWARANLVDLADSYAYSDSFFDLPLLSRVGHPVAVNPDYRLLLYARARNWPIVWFNAPPGVPKPIGIEPQRLLAPLARPELLPWVRIDLEGLDRLNDSGGCLLAANHRSYLDPLLLAYTAARIGRPIRFLAKKEVTEAPLVGPITTALGAIRVDRGSGSDEPLVQARAALQAGEMVAVFPQGTIPGGHDFFDPVLRGRPGAVALARDTGLPLIPVGIWGSEVAWPRNSRLPYVLNLADPPTVQVRIGQPYRPATTDLDVATDELMDRIVDLLPPVAHRPHEPTEAELARTHPPA